MLQCYVTSQAEIIHMAAQLSLLNLTTHNISWLFEQFKVDFSFPQNCLNLLSPESDQNQFSSITISKQAMI